jgi:hypothetical protein
VTAETQSESSVRRCKSCLHELPISEFNRTGRKDSRRWVCRVCYNESNRIYAAENRDLLRAKNKKLYYKNRDKILAGQRARISANREFVSDLKRKPCSICGKSYPPECMDFHHPNPDKEKGIAQIYGRSLENILAEIKKCELVCSNCHRSVHFG